MNYYWKICVLLLIYCDALLLFVSCKPQNLKNAASAKNRKCGYEGCPTPKNGMLNVHLVPHTHDDVGWLKTVDQYYYGSKNLVQKAGVQYIIDSVVEELLTDPEKKFIYAESVYFFKWWKEQTEYKQQQVKELVNEGRLEFIGGAWTMNDEATTHYQSTIDQFTWGLRYLNDTFGECGRPRVGWQIDPFGHSREMASMFAQMGYDGLFFGRLDHQDKHLRLIHKTPEMIWHGSANLGEKADLFTGALYNNYGPPPGFCFDILCADEPIIDDTMSPEYNVPNRINAFLNYVRSQARSYKTDNIILTMGGDFTYMDANVYYKNLDKIIRYGNERQKNGSDINLMYSTPSCYLKSLHDAGIKWPSKSDDFFPYSSDPHAFWTGYFTSRPTLKRFERIGNNFLQVCKQLTALAPIKRKSFEVNLDLLREAMGIMQHHDAVTGTEKQNVAEDYARILHRAIHGCTENVKDILNQFTSGKDNLRKNYEPNVQQQEYQFGFHSCLNLNISQCFVTENNNNFIITLYNPLAHSTFQYVRVPVMDDKYTVKDYRGIPAVSQTVPIPKSVQNLHYRRSNAIYDLVFLAIELPPLGFKSYFVAHDSKEFQPEVFLQMDQPIEKPNFYGFIPEHKEPEEIIIGNKYVQIKFDKNGLLATITINGVERNLTQQFFYYVAHDGNNNVFKNRASGAYIFRPNGTEILIADVAEIRVIRGDVVDEVHQKFNDWVSQVVRIYKDEDLVEFEWMIGPIPVWNDRIGKEIVSRFITDIKSDGVFYTDSNGREMIKRKRDHRDTWDVKLQEPVAGNYYPVTSKIVIEDDSTRLAILNDRSQAGSSLVDGTIELMVHRRLLYDDAFGVNEALNEEAYGKGLIARGQHYLIIGPKESKRRQQQQQQQLQPSIEAHERFTELKKLLPAWIFVSNASSINFINWQNQFSHIYSAMSLSLPQNVHLLTFEPWKEHSILIRFEHILEQHEDSMYSKSVKFNINDIFNNFNIESIRETTLSGNQWLDEAKRMKFIEETNIKSGHIKSGHIKSDQLANANNNNNNVQPGLTPFSDDNDHHVENKFDKMANPDPDLMNITLKPMEIRTFVITFEWSP